MSSSSVPAHDQTVNHKYVIHYPAHPARKSDPFYKDFLAYKKRTKTTAKCAMGEHRGDFSECAGGLELHHAHIEFAMQNGVDPKLLERDYPGISNPDEVGAWIESEANLIYYCVRHHRGDAGVHVLSSADFEAQKYVRDLTG